MRLVPRSLSGRLIGVVLAILVAAQLIGFALHVHDRGELLMQASGMRAAQQIADIVRLFESTAPAERRRVAAVLSRPPLVVSFDRPAFAHAANDDGEAGASAAFFGALLRRFLDGDRPLAVRVREPGGSAPPSGAPYPGPAGPGWGMRHGGPPGAGPMPHFARAGLLVTTQVRLRDGELVTFQSGLPPQTTNWPLRLLASFAILLAAAAVAALIAVRWATRPLGTLARAAEALGRDVNRPPLPEAGPVEVTQAARAFNTMQARLVAYLRSHTEVVAAMSHDLKTPITRMKLRTELLDDAALREKFERDLAELEAMVLSALEFLRGVEDGEQAIALDVVALLESLRADFEETGARVTLAGAAAGPLRARRLALRRCLGNLIDNAVKYGDAAHVSVAEAGGAVEIRVRDQGPGLPPEELVRVFDPFYRVEASRSRETGGTGLGLAIARQVARAHGGDVTLRNAEGGGLEAILVLPRDRP